MQAAASFSKPGRCLRPSFRPSSRSSVLRPACRAAVVSAPPLPAFTAVVLSAPPAEYVEASNIVPKKQGAVKRSPASAPRPALQAPTCTPLELRALSLGLQALHDTTASELGAVSHRMRAPQAAVAATLVQAHRQRLPAVHQPQRAATHEEEAFTAAAALGSLAQQQRLPPVLLSVVEAQRVEASHRLRFPKVHNSSCSQRCCEVLNG